MIFNQVKRDLRDINIREIERKIAPFKNAFLHRKRYLKAISRIAATNMIFLSKIIEDGAGDMEKIIEETLLIQGLELSVVNKFLLPWVTFLPVKLYLSLLFSHIEWFQKQHKEKEMADIYRDDELFKFFAANKEWVFSLKGLRDGFLHPESAWEEKEEIFFNIKGAHNRAPEIQEKLESYFSSVQHKLHEELNRELDCLKEWQRIYVEVYYSLLMIEKGVSYDDSFCVDYHNSKLELLKDKREYLLYKDKSIGVELNKEQKKKAHRLAECFVAVSLLESEIRHLPIKGKQKPFTSPLLLTKKKFIGQIDRYQDVTLTIDVLINELHDGTRKDFRSEIADMSPLMVEEELAICRLIFGLSYIIFKAYKNKSKKDPSVKNSLIDKFLDKQGTMEAMRLQRNCIFHIPDVNSQDEDFMLSNAALEGADEYFQIWTALQESYGIII